MRLLIPSKHHRDKATDVPAHPQGTRRCDADVDQIGLINKAALKVLHLKCRTPRRSTIDSANALSASGLGLKHLRSYRLLCFT